MEEKSEKDRTGKVVSNKMDKTIVVAVENNVKHRFIVRSLREPTS